MTFWMLHPLNFHHGGMLALPPQVLNHHPMHRSHHWRNSLQSHHLHFCCQWRTWTCPSTTSPFHSVSTNIQPESLEILEFPNPCKSILHPSKDMSLAMRTCALACCKPVIMAEAPNMSPDEAQEKLQSWFCLGLNHLKELTQNWGQHCSQ